MRRFICLLIVSAVLAATDYNEDEARTYLTFAAAAYADSPLPCLQSAFPAAQNVTLLSTTSLTCDSLASPCSGYVAKSDVLSTIFVVFRGTKTTAQLLAEGWSTLKPQREFYGMGLVNDYFGRASDLLFDEVNEALTSPQYENYSVVFTGHSLGAALAALAAARTVAQGLRRSTQVKMYTFGEPRVGNVQFATAFNQAVPEAFRVVFRSDIVPHLPGCNKDYLQDTSAEDDSEPCNPNDLVHGYHHQMEIWYPECMTAGCEYKICSGAPIGEDFSCSDQLKFDAKNTSLYIWDHRHYFDLKVTEFGQNGCNASDPAVHDASPDDTPKLEQFLFGLGEVVSGLTGQR